jgi:hypothetical protein
MGSGAAHSAGLALPRRFLAQTRAAPQRCRLTLLSVTVDATKLAVTPHTHAQHTHSLPPPPLPPHTHAHAHTPRVSRSATFAWPLLAARKLHGGR